MGTPITYLSGGTMGYQSGVFKNATTALGFTFPLTSGYRWWNGVDTSSSQYLLYSDIHSVGQSTVANGRPTAWSTPDLTDQSLLNLINTLPERVGKGLFTSVYAALDWLQSTGTYFLLKTGYENIVTSNLQLNYDAGWYTSYAGTGTAVTDLSGNNRTGTLTNGVNFISSGVGAFDFDGTNDYITSSLATSANNNVSLEAWFNSDNVNQDGQMIIYNGSDNAGNGYGFSINQENVTSGNIYVLYGALSWFNTGFSLLSGNWYHVIMTISNTTLKVYCNGYLIYTASSSNPNTPTLYTNVGRNDFPAARYFNGKIAVARVYTLALTAEQVLQNYNAQKGRFGVTSPVQNGLILEYDAANPTSYPGTGTVWTDVSGYANNGTLTNGPTFNSSNGGSISFDGTDDRVSTNFKPSGYRSYIVWVKYNIITGLSAGYALTGTQEVNAYNYLGISNGGYFYYYFGTNGEQINGTVLSANIWYMQCVTLSSDGFARAYLNGYLVSTLSSGVGNTATNEFSVGCVNQNHFVNGYISSVMQYDRTLSAPEIQQNFYAYAERYGVGIVRSGLVLNLDAGNFGSYPTSGTTWYDLSGNVNDGVLVNGPTYSTSNGGVIDFDGTDDYGYVVRNTSTSPTNGLTQEAWVNFDVNDVTQVVIGLQYGTGSGNSYALWFQPNNFLGGVNVGGNFDYFGYAWTPTVGNWYHLVHTWDGSTQKLYINNSQVNSYSTSGTLTYDSNNTNIAIGGDYNGSGYNQGMTATVNGKIGAVRIYNRALSAGEISTNYNADKARYGL